MVLFEFGMLKGNTRNFMWQGGSMNMGMRFNLEMVQGRAYLSPVVRDGDSDCVSITRRNTVYPVPPDQEELMSRVMKRTETTLNNISSLRGRLCPQLNGMGSNRGQDVDHQMSLFSMTW